MLPEPKYSMKRPGSLLWYVEDACDGADSPVEVRAPGCGTLRALQIGSSGN